MSESTQNKRAFKLKIWQIIIVPIILALIPLLYPEVKALFIRKLPQFVIEDPIISRGDSVLHIFAENGPARKREALNIEVEGLEFRDAGKLVRDNPLEWEFNFNQYDIPDVLFTEGLNTIRIGFPSSVGYDELKVYVRPDFYQRDDIAVGQDFVPKVSSIDKEELEYLDRAVKKVYVASVARENDERVGVTVSALRGQGITASGNAHRVNMKDVQRNEVRYFSPEDKREAEDLATILEKDLDIEVKVVNESKQLELQELAQQKTKGVIEIIFAETPSS
ncbi:MAG: hypothetical protein AAGI23_04655 [Bacteroidota bacterium]